MFIFFVLKYFDRLPVYKDEVPDVISSAAEYVELFSTLSLS